MTGPNGGGRSTRQWMLWAWKLHGCTDCGRRFPEIALQDIHADHLDPGNKRRERNHGIANPGDGGLRAINTNQALLDELLGCEPVCVDCHKARTRRRSQRAEMLAMQETLFVGTGEAWRLNGA